MAKKRITQLAAKTSPTTTDVLHIASSGADNKITYNNLKKAILDNKTIGVDIVTIDAIQTLTNKGLIAPVVQNIDCQGGQVNNVRMSAIILADQPVNVDGQQITRICSSNASTAELNTVIGVISPIQAQINSKVDKLMVGSYLPYCFSKMITADSSTHIVSRQQILSEIGASAVTRTIDILGFNWNIWMVRQHTMDQISDIECFPQLQTILGQKHIRQIKILNLDNGSDYVINFYFRMKNFSGGGA